MEGREEIIELVYCIQADHDGNLPERETQKFGPWAKDAIRRAKKIRWLIAKALDAALSSREVDIPQPHWFGGSIVPVSSVTGPVLPANSYQPYKELKSWALEQGILTQEDIERVARAPRQEHQEPVFFIGGEPRCDCPDFHKHGFADVIRGGGGVPTDGQAEDRSPPLARLARRWE